MDRERAKKLLPIIQAFAEGKIIEYRESSTRNWYPVGNLDFRFLGEYRIKPEPITRLMTRMEMLGFISHTPNLVIGGRLTNRKVMLPVYEFNDPSDWEWNIINPDGSLQGDWKPFTTDKPLPEGA